MDVTVLKPFPYAEDGVTSKILAVGREIGIDDKLVAGLVKEGYVLPKGYLPAKAEPPVGGAPLGNARAEDRVSVSGVEPRPRDPQLAQEPTRTASPAEALALDAATPVPAATDQRVETTAPAPSPKPAVRK